MGLKHTRWPLLRASKFKDALSLGGGAGMREEHKEGAAGIMGCNIPLSLQGSSCSASTHKHTQNPKSLSRETQGRSRAGLPGSTGKYTSCVSLQQDAGVGGVNKRKKTSKGRLLVCCEENPVPEKCSVCATPCTVYSKGELCQSQQAEGGKHQAVSQRKRFCL